jgi:hypothetical protein
VSLNLGDLEVVGASQVPLWFVALVAHSLGHPIDKAKVCDALIWGIAIIRYVEIVATAETNDEVVSPETIDGLMVVLVRDMLCLMSDWEQESLIIRLVVADLIRVPLELYLSKGTEYLPGVTPKNQYNIRGFPYFLVETLLVEAIPTRAIH